MYEFSDPKPRVIYVIEFYNENLGWMPTTEQSVTTSPSDAEGQLKKLRSHYQSMNLPVLWKITTYGEVVVPAKEDMLGPHGCFSENPPAGVP